MTNVKQQLHNMYIGFVYINWANKENTQLGTAKQKALQQMKTFAQTIENKSPVAHEIQSNVNDMSRIISRQIMTDKSSEFVLDKKQAGQYRAFGERQVTQSKQMLNSLVKQLQQSMPMDMAHNQQKQPTAQAKGYNGAKLHPQQMNREFLMRILMQQNMQKSA